MRGRSVLVRECVCEGEECSGACRSVCVCEGVRGRSVLVCVRV